MRTKIIISFLVLFLSIHAKDMNGGEDMEEENNGETDMSGNSTEIMDNGNSTDWMHDTDNDTESSNSMENDTETMNATSAEANDDKAESMGSMEEESLSSMEEEEEDDDESEEEMDEKKSMSKDKDSKKKCKDCDKMKMKKKKKTKDSGEDMDEEAEGDMVKKGGGQCKMEKMMGQMAESIEELTEEISSLRDALVQKCPGLADSQNETDSMDSAEMMEDDMESTNETSIEQAEDKGDMESEEELPPIPTSCPAPFQPVAAGCYYFLYYNADWRTWGEANSYCQTLGGSLSSPSRPDALREYLTENFSNVFWVGARRTEDKKKIKFQWLDGTPFLDDLWKEDHPKHPAAKFCIYLEFFSGYKAVNHYCGEKFPFICEFKEEQ